MGKANWQRLIGNAFGRLTEVWQAMIQRCINPKNKSYSSYGGRDIAVCDRWRNSFEAFRGDMGECPPGHSLDRIDNDGNYDPDNCRWATPPIQNRNQRSNKLLTHNGVTKTITDWAKDLGLNRSSLYDRLEAGWPIERALTENKTR